MSLFSKLFKLFVGVVLIPFVPMLLLLAYYQFHLTDNLLETHANLAQLVSTSMTQHIEDLTWRLSFAGHVSAALQKKQNPQQLLQDALQANPDFLFLAVLSSAGKEMYRAGDAQVLRQLPPLNLEESATLGQLAGSRQVSLSRFDVLDGRPISEFILPLSNGDFLYGLLDFTGFLSRVQEQPLGHTGRIYLVDAAGNIFTQDSLYPAAFEPADLRRVFSGRTRLIKSLRTPQETFVGAFAPSPVFGAYVLVVQQKSEAYRSIYYTNIILALFLLTIATLSYFGALTFAEQLGEPIVALSHAAQEVSRGNFDEKVDPEIGWGEFKELINAFNQMTADLKDYRELRLQAQVSELKEQVFRAVAHDLRAPLMGLQGYLYILQNSTVSAEERARYLDLMGQAARNLSALLEDVLELSRFQAGMARVKKQPVALARLVQETVDQLAASAQEKGLLLTAQVPEMTVQADPKLLCRILTNLISNAIKFTEHGFVRVGGKETAHSIKLTVQDSGIGLTQQQAKQIFQKYHQVSNDKPGFGLGLYISRQLVQAHGGTLRVQSKPGEGSTFTVSLPKEEK